MSDIRKAARVVGTTTAGSRFPECPACGARQRERVSRAAHDIP